MKLQDLEVLEDLTAEQEMTVAQASDVELVPVIPDAEATLGTPAQPTDVELYPVGDAEATLGVIPEGTGYYWIPVEGVFPMSRAAAQATIDQGYTAQLRLWGEDPVSDDLQHTYPQEQSLWAGDDGLHFRQSARVSRSVVNEDDSWIDRHDELYVGVRVVAPSGHISLTVESNHVGGYF